MAYIIAEPCVDLKDASCVDVCPVDCIYEGETMYYIQPDECIDCAACEPVCPVAAIFAARSSASKYLGNARPDSTSATSSCVPPWMTCASAAYNSSRSRHRGTRASMDAA